MIVIVGVRKVSVSDSDCPYFLIVILGVPTVSDSDCPYRVILVGKVIQKGNTRHAGTHPAKLL